MATLCAGICSPLRVWEKRRIPRGSPSVVRGSRPRGEVAGLPWNQWQPSPGMDGRLAMESVAAFVWNQWQRSCGIAGRFAVESVAGLAWNTQQRSWYCLRNRRSHRNAIPIRPMPRATHWCNSDNILSLTRPIRGLFLCECFNDGRFLAPLGFLDRNEPPGFGVSSHLKGFGLAL